MPPSDFLGFFVSSVGAGGALVGLLFVAVSLAPERTIAPGAPAHARASALSAFTGLLNAFFISMVAQIPRLNIATPLLIIGGGSLLSALVTGYSSLTGAEKGGTRISALVFTLANAALYGAEILAVALPLGAHPNDRAPFYVLAFLLTGIYASALTRAWTLMGGGSMRLFSRALDLARKEAKEVIETVPSSRHE